MIILQSGSCTVANNNVSPSLYICIAVQIAFEKTAYTITGREIEVEVCIHVAEAPVPAKFDVVGYIWDVTAGTKCLFK